MTYAPTRPAAALLAALTLAACASTPNAPDAAPDVARTDAAPDVAAPDAAAPDAAPDAATPDVAPPDAAPDAATPDASACENFSGTYTFDGMCGSSSWPVPRACITQTGCSARILVADGPVTGTAEGNALRFPARALFSTVECTATRAADGRLSVGCLFGSGVPVCEATATPVAFPGATRWCCDLAAQDCGAGMRCNVVGAGPDNAMALTACVPAGTLAEGAACTRADGRLGADGCGAGLTCTNYGQARATDRSCSRTCRSSADCASGSSCVVMTDVPHGGVCRPRCTPLGTDCAAGTCRYLESWDANAPATVPIVRVPVCRPVGTAGENAGCTDSVDCGPNLACGQRFTTSSFTCRRICDATRPCPAGSMCDGLMIEDNPSASGLCFPP